MLESGTSSEVKGEADGFLGVVFLAPPPFLFPLTPLPCYLNFQISALMSIVRTSRGLLAHQQVLLLETSTFFWGEEVHHIPSRALLPLEMEPEAPEWPLPGPWTCASLWGDGCAPELSLLLFKACLGRSVFLQSG